MKMSEINEHIKIALAENSNKDEWVRICCPCCESLTGKPDKRESMGVHSSGHYHCFKCGYKGFLKGYSTDSTKYSPSTKQKTIIVNPMPLPKEYIPLWKGIPKVKDGLDYVLSRGITIETIEAARIGCAVEGFFKDRIIFPVFDSNRDKTVGYVARLWRKKQEGEKVYLYPKGMRTGSFLYDQHLLYKKTNSPLLLVEGVLDALPYHGQACAFFGKPSRIQKKLLEKANRPLVIAMDSDALVDTKRLFNYLKGRNRIVDYIALPKGEDPNSVGVTWMMNKISNLVF